MTAPENMRLQIVKNEATGEPTESSHAILLEEAYDNLSHELELNGDSPKLQELRELYFERFLTYWHTQIAEHKEASRSGGFEDSETKLVVIRGLNPHTGRPILDAYQTGLDGRDHVNIELNFDRSFDFNYPPTIHSFVNDPSGRQTVYHFEFRDGMVSRMHRSKEYSDPSEVRAPINAYTDINFQSLNTGATTIA